MATQSDNKQTMLLVDSKTSAYPGDSKSSYDQTTLSMDEMLARQMQDDWNKADSDQIDSQASKKSNNGDALTASHDLPRYAGSSKAHRKHINQVTEAADLRKITEVSCQLSKKGQPGVRLMQLVARDAKLASTTAIQISHIQHGAGAGA